MSDPPPPAPTTDLDSILASAQSSQQVLSKQDLLTHIDTTWSGTDATVLKAWIECPHLPDEAAQNLSKLVTTSADHAATISFLQTTILGTLKSTGGKTPPLTPISTISSPPETRRQTQHLDLLSRDQGRDQISGHYSWDIETLRAIPEYRNELGGLGGVELTGKNTVHTIGAHVFPCQLGAYSLAQTTVTRARQKRVDEFWRAITFLFPPISARIGPNSIDSLRNRITMAETLHPRFGGFDFGLKHQTDDFYEPIFFRKFPPFLNSLFRRDAHGRYIIQFRYRAGCPDVEKVDRYLLVVHLALAHVLNETGARELMEWEEYEEEGGEGEYRDDGRFVEVLCARLGGV